jgi:hypothetical protein
MGEMKRAEARERAIREARGEVRQIVIAWKCDGPKWLVNFVDARSRRPLTRQRVYASAEPIRGFVARSLSGVKDGPDKSLFQHNLVKGFGEIEVEISGVQFERLTSS